MRNVNISLKHQNNRLTLIKIRETVENKKSQMKKLFRNTFNKNNNFILNYFVESSCRTKSSNTT